MRASRPIHSTCVALLLASTVLFTSGSACTTFPGKNGRIALVAKRSRAGSCTRSPDGSDIVQITDLLATDLDLVPCIFAGWPADSRSSRNARWEGADDRSLRGTGRECMTKLQVRGEDDLPSPRRRSDDYKAVAFMAFLRQQCRNCPIHGRELSFFVDCKAQQVCIGHLLVTLQSSLEGLNGMDEADLVPPEPMRGVVQIGTQKFHGFLRSYRIRRKRRIRNDSHESGLGERAGCPALVGVSVEPILRSQVSFMGRPQ
jgi:hypothetical protein